MVELGHPERPIQSPEDDTLSREGFVRRLVAALINLETRSASGVVIGLTGPWGSGKSSVLNLVAARTAAEHNDAIVVRFDPWLISGRNDLISSFIIELLSQLKRGDKTGKLKGVVDAVSEYGQQLAPLADLVFAGAGMATAIGLGIVRRFTEKKTVSLVELRGKLEKALSDAAVPIIILIDEVDRVEDSEIRAIAQLVRAVADFPSMSYLLAYDADRVAQALGTGASPNDVLDRGRSYLEKIVQLQIPLPITDDASISRMITGELGKLQRALSLPNSFTSVERYGEMINIISGGVIATPRDVSRLIGTYHALRGMLIGEVDWVDLLGYCALLTKAPGIAARIKREPGMFLAQTLSRRDALREVGQSKLTVIERLALATGEPALALPTRELLQELFPAFAEFSGGEKRYLDAISSRRALLTTLHLGLAPGSYGHEHVTNLVRGNADDVCSGLRTAYERDTIEDLINRIEDLYPTLEGVDHLEFWSGVAQFAAKPDCRWMGAFVPMNSIIRSLSEILHHAVRKNPTQFEPVAKSVFEGLRSAGESELTAFWLRWHIFEFGLYGQSSRDRDRAFLKKEQVVKAVEDGGVELKSLHLQGMLIPCRWDLQPVYTMLDAEKWDDACRAALAQSLGQDDAADGLTLMLFGAHYSTDASTVDRMCGIDVLLEASTRRLGGGAPMHESVRLAHAKALEHLERTSA